VRSGVILRAYDEIDVDRRRPPARQDRRSTPDQVDTEITFGGACERIHELADAIRVDRLSHALGSRFGGSLETHESADQRIVLRVRGVAHGLAEQRVEAQLRIAHALGNVEPETPETRGADRDEQCRHRLPGVSKIRESLLNEVGALFQVTSNGTPTGRGKPVTAPGKQP